MNLFADRCPISQLPSQTNLHSEPREGFQSLVFNNRSHRPEKLPRHPQEGGPGPVSMVSSAVASHGTCDGGVPRRDLVLVDQLLAIPVGR